MWNDHAYNIGGRTRFPIRLCTETPLVLLATFAVCWIGWTTFVRLPQVTGIGGIAHVRVDLGQIALRMTKLSIQSDGCWEVEGHGESGVDVLRRRWCGRMKNHLEWDVLALISLESYPTPSPQLSMAPGTRR